jgi:hypothetical protein
LKTVRILLKKSPGACDYYRAILPYRHLHKVLKQNGVELSTSYGLAAEERVDGVVVHRVIPPDFLAHLLVRRVAGTKFAYDTDDDLLRIPTWSPAAISDGARELVLASRVAADFCWAATPHLTKTMAAIPNCISRGAIHLPNLVDLEAWNNGQEAPTDDKRIRLLYTGSNTHGKDLETVEAAIAEILRRYRTVDLLFYGDPPSKWVASWHGRLRHIEWSMLTDYPTIMMDIKPHIGICPLTNHEFNNSKSSIKFAEMTLAGAAVVASPLPPYQIEQMQAMRYATSPEEWVASLSELIENQRARQEQQA